ncbi:MAG: serine hydrolase [Halomonas sp.]|uniref:serine hydrolase n=1 Tax=Halomonas sp. TaxID=1486246 RepID=UPI0019F479A3|nr:serine hydrolase [Halomonas sp.]MBE0488865.1 serine hydrolase [Halomonas sp.]
MKWLTAVVISSLVMAAPALAGSPWEPALEARLAALEAEGDDEIGLHVRELGVGDGAEESGERFGWRDDETWYLASLIKVPVAVELLARVEAGELSLDETLVLEARDYVDGAGPTNWAEPGTALTLGELLEPMLTVSDNTASDLLIGRLGLAAVNERARALSGGGLGPITPLIEVRREAYGQLHPGARALTGMDFILLRRVEQDAARLDALAERLDVPRSDLALPSLDAAFEAYYATGLNAGRLDAFGELLAAIGEGRALGPAATAELLAIMGATTSGESRLKAGLGPEIRFAHKTGTQHRRTCDAGIASRGEGAAEGRLVVVACTRGERDSERSERVLREVGRALGESGLLGP